MKRLAVLSTLILAGALSACAGFDFNQRGWEVSGYAALPPQGPFVEQHYVQPRPVRVVRAYDHYEHERTYTRTVRAHCSPPHRLMEPSPYYADDYVERYRALQRYVLRECR